MTSLIEPIKIKKKKLAQLIVSNIMYPEIKDTERNNKGFSDEVF